MTEKDMFIQTWEREFQTTLKVMKAYPKDRLDLKPSEKSRSAKDLLWTLVSEEHVASGVTKGQVDFTNVPKAPDSVEEIIGTYERMHKENLEKVKNLSEQDYNSSIQFFVGPKTPGLVRRADVLWTTVMDNVHHRGQLSVYLRLVGAKVPSIYGPTADEPWM